MNEIYPRPRNRLMSEINVVPYIDVMLVLLVIFMTTAPLLVQGVSVDLPDANAEPMDKRDLDDPLVVSMRADGATFLNIGIAAEGEGERLLPETLAEQVRKVMAARPDAPVLLRADTRLEYGQVIRLMARLQGAGAASVGLITEPEALR